MGSPRFHLICNIERNKHRRLMATAPAPRDAEGPAGTTGCACTHRDATCCAEDRYGRESGERCQCVCHQWPDED